MENHEGIVSRILGLDDCKEFPVIDIIVSLSRGE